MTRLVLTRHGEALCNVERRIEGVATCRGLTDVGRSQAALLAERLRREHIEPDVVVASPIRRARETAEIVCAALDWRFTIDPDFEEVRPGEAEGMTWDQYMAYYGATEGWDPSLAFAPGAEAWSDFGRRVGTALDRVTDGDDGTTVVVFAHGGVVDVSLFHYFGMDPELQPPIELKTSNTSITEWTRRLATLPNDDQVHRWRLCRYNDAAHLLEG